MRPGAARFGIGTTAKTQMPIGQASIRPRVRLGLACLAASLCVGLSACSDPGIVTVKAELRRVPADKSEVLATIPKGSVVKVRDCSNGWCRTSWNGRDGYILTKNVRIGGSVRPDADANRPDSDEDNLAVPDASGEAGPND
jgi:uncharacterized protein YraI